MSQSLHIRLATAEDLPAINAIYNHYVHHSTCTYQTEPSTDAERFAWYQAHGPEHPITLSKLTYVFPNGLRWFSGHGR